MNTKSNQNEFTCLIMCVIFIVILIENCTNICNQFFFVIVLIKEHLQNYWYLASKYSDFFFIVFYLQTKERTHSICKRHTSDGGSQIDALLLFYD